MLARKSTAVSSRAAAQELFAGAKYALLDCGGTLWQADRPLPRINETLDFMRNDLGLRLRFVTNNATVSRRDTLAKFHSIGLTHVTEEEIFSSAYAAQQTLRRNGRDGSRPDSVYDRGNVLVLGNDGLHEEIQPALAPGLFAYGRELKIDSDRTNCDGEPLVTQSTPYDIRVVGRCWKEPLLPPPAAWAGQTQQYQRRGVALHNLGITAVVIGLDFKFSPTSLALACMVLQQHNHGFPKALFIATNNDPQMPIPGGWLMPGCGSMVAALEVASGRKPDYVCGKPTTKMFRIFQEAEEVRGFSVTPEECVVVGDRLSTDIVFGNAVGARTLHVATGCETIDEVPPVGSMSDERRLRHIPQFHSTSLVHAVDAFRGIVGDDVKSPLAAAAAMALAQPTSGRPPKREGTRITRVSSRHRMEGNSPSS